ncbi:unnamed protein product [Scytosiphon promiscuus]
MDYFVRHGVESAEIVPAVDSDYTASDTSTANGAVFVKTVIFQADGKPFAAVMREDLVADRGAMARHLRLTSRQVTLAKVPYVEEVTGFPVGTIPPLGHRTRVPTLVDAELLKYSTIIGGAGLRGFDSRLSVRDLLKATGASVIPLAKPRSRGGGYEQGGIIATGGSTGGGGGGGGTGAKAPMLSWYSSAATIPTNGLPSAVNARDCTPEGRDDEPAQPQRDPEEQGLGTANAAFIGERDDAGTKEGTEIKTNGDGAQSSSSSSNGGGDADGRNAAEGGVADSSEGEAKLRVISAAMHAVSVALSALSTLQDGHGGGGGTDSSGGDVQSPADGGSNDGSGRIFERPVLSSKPGTLREGGTAGAEDGGGGGDRAGLRNPSQIGDGAESATETTSRLQAVGRGTAAATADNDLREVTAADRTYPIDGDDTSSAGGLGRSPRGDNAAAAGVAAAAHTGAIVGVAAEAALPDVVESKGAAAAEGGEGYGRELARAAGTPTVDAIGGDVHLVAIVAGKRSLTRLLHFVDLVPPTEEISVTNQTCLVRKAWMVPGTGQGQAQGPVKVQLIMGKTLVDRLGQQEALVAMRGIKRGQLLYITGRPTPDTRKKYLDDPSTTSRDSESGGGGDGKPGTYDLVCCSVRMLEDAPLVDPGLVGKGDEWTGGGNYLEMDLDDSAVTYVDSTKRLKEMGDFLRKTLLDEPWSGVAATAAASTGRGKGSRSADANLQRPALAVDCEWRPARVAGMPANPVSLMQLAAGERTFVVDMFHVCRPRHVAANDAAEGGLSSGLTKKEALLEDALGAVLGSPGVAKVGLGPKADFQSLIRSYPHMPCFRRVLCVVNLCHVASNASSLRGKPADEKGSLSRLCNLVLGKPLDKSEQCSDWGNRPLSGRQKRYAALDARSTLLVHRHLAPQVPAERMECLFNTLAYDHRADGMVATQTLPSTQRSPAANGRASRQQPGVRSRAGRTRKLRAGGSRQERMLRKQLLGVTMINVSEVLLDAEGLRNNWLGRALPGLTKEGAVRACIFPRGEMPKSGELPTVLRFDRHQSFVEFCNGYALLMNCGGPPDREHASGFLDENGSTAAWYLRGQLSSDAALVDIDNEAAEFQRQQQDSLRRAQTGTSSAGTAAAPPQDLNGGGAGGGVPSGRAAAFSAGGTGAGDTVDGAGGSAGGGGDAIGKFLQRLADASGTPSSMLGGLPEDDPPAYPERQTAGTPPAAATGDTLPDFVGARAGDQRQQQQQQGQGPPHLVLFARAKGRPFVYCGEVDSVAQEYVWSAGSSLGAVRFTLSLREWRQAAAVVAQSREEGEEGGTQNGGREGTRGGIGGGGVGRGAYGGGNAFAGLVEEGFEPPRDRLSAPAPGLPPDDARDGGGVM